jgi:hypothetical protein
VNCSLGLKVGAKASLSLVRSRLEGDEETSGDILLLQPPGPEWSIEANESRCSVVDSSMSHVIYQDQKEVIFLTVHVAITFRFSVLQSVFRIRRDPHPFEKLHPNPHLSGKMDPDPHQSEIRIKVKKLKP